MERYRSGEAGHRQSMARVQFRFPEQTEIGYPDPLPSFG